MRTRASGERRGVVLARLSTKARHDAFEKRTSPRGHRRIAVLLSAKYNDVVSARDTAKALGRRGGLARARRLSAERRRQIASLGGTSRARSLQAARRIDENFRYVAALRELRGASSAVTRVATFEGPLPGIYAERLGVSPLKNGLSRRGR